MLIATTLIASRAPAAEDGVQHKPQQIDRRTDQSGDRGLTVDGNDRGWDVIATMNDIQNRESCTATCPRKASSTSICIALSAHNFTI